MSSREGGLTCEPLPVALVLLEVKHALEVVLEGKVQSLQRASERARGVTEALFPRSPSHCLSH